MTSRRRPLVRVLLSVGGGLLLALIGLLVVGPHRVKTNAMSPTISERPHFVLALRCSYNVWLPLMTQPLLRPGVPSRGDIVLLSSPDGGESPLVLRVAGLPGDSVELRNEVLYINGRAAPLTFELPSTRSGDTTMVGHTVCGEVAHDILVYPERAALRTFGPVAVSSDHVFLLGDNRDRSHDSRFFGTRPIQDLLGRILFPR